MRIVRHVHGWRHIHRHRSIDDRDRITRQGGPARWSRVQTVACGIAGMSQRKGEYAMTADHHDKARTPTREPLLTGAFDAHIDRIDVHRIVLRAGQKPGCHVHAGGVVGYVVEGAITFEIAGQPATMLGQGDAFYEPPGATITRFDNASDTAPATFVAFYPLTGDQALISMLDR